LKSIVNSRQQYDSVRNGASSILAEQTVFPLGMKMAAVFMVMLPIMCVYPFVQKYFTKGIMLGAVKM